MTALPSRSFTGRRTAVLLVALLAFGVLLGALAQLVSPSDIDGNDQSRPASYALDALVNGDWIVQRDPVGDVMSKPPVTTWLIALAGALTGGVARWTLLLPNVLALLATMALVVIQGTRRFGGAAGFLAAAMVLLCQAGGKQIGVVRTDTVYTALTFACALALYETWRRGRGWPVFFALATAATLTKGPMALVMAFGGLLALPWEKRRHHAPRLRLGLPFAGSALAFVLISGGWLLLAWSTLGDAVIEKIIGQELVGMAVSPQHGRVIGQSLLHPAAYLLTRFLPWSLLGLAGIVRAFRHPAEDDDERRFERFLVAYVLFGLVLVGLGTHRRPPLSWPQIPATALLAARELDRWWQPARWRSVVVAFAIGLVVFVPTITAWNWLSHRDDDGVRRTATLQHTAAWIEERVPSDFPFVHVDTPHTLQLMLGTARFRSPPVAAVAALRSGLPAFVLVSANDDGTPQLPADDAGWRTLATWELAGSPDLLLVSSADRLAPTDRLATTLGPVVLELDGLRMVASGERHARLEAVRPGARLQVRNLGDEPTTLRVQVPNAIPPIDRTIELAAGAGNDAAVATLAPTTEVTRRGPSTSVMIAGALVWTFVAVLLLWLGWRAALALRRASDHAVAERGQVTAIRDHRAGTASSSPARRAPAP